jgi:3'-phosphoadenosine 5'-phosphosulfate sulfotransferase (PAPS reductase)/FAD synthetase
VEVGAVVLDDIKKIARVLGVKVVELFLSPGRTEAERVILALWRGSRQRRWCRALFCLEPITVCPEVL